MRFSISSLLQLALDGLPDGWLFIPEGLELSLDSSCYLIAEADPSPVEDEHGWRRITREGLTYVESLDSDTLLEIVSAACHLEDPPSVELLFEALVYYHHYDAFLPEPHATPPPSAHQIAERQDREFIEALGPERPEPRCRHQGCRRGTISSSVFCALHHFEMIKGYPYPWLEDGQF